MKREMEERVEPLEERWSRSSPSGSSVGRVDKSAADRVDTVGDGDARVERSLGLDQPPARRNVARRVDAIAHVGPELIEIRAPGNRPPMPTIAIASSGCIIQFGGKSPITAIIVASFGRFASIGCLFSMPVPTTCCLRHFGFVRHVSRLLRAFVILDVSLYCLDTIF